MSTLKLQHLFGIILATLCIIAAPPQSHAATKAKSKAVQPAKERLVLMPLRLGEEDQNLQGAMEMALVKGLQQKYEVFFGEQVAKKAREIFMKESRNTSKKECDETRCLQGIAEAFQAELLATANITKKSDGYFIALSVQNLFDNKVVQSESVPCKGCDAYAVIEKLKELVGTPAPVAAAPIAEPPTPKITATDADSITWAEAQKGNTADDYQVYLDAYPKGKYIAFAKAKFKKLKEAEQAAAEQQEQKAWDTAQQENSEASYSLYIKGYPNGRFVGFAKVRMDKLKNDVAAREEAAQWKVAQASDNGNTIQNFLDKYPQSSHFASAQERLAAIRKAVAETPKERPDITPPRVSGVARDTSSTIQNSIASISAISAVNGKIVLKVELMLPLVSLPVAMSINVPPRIALDFPNTTNGLGKSIQTFDEGDLRSVNVVQAGSRTRLVVNLSQMLSYDIQIDGNNLLITLQGKATTGSAELVTTARFAEAKPTTQAHSLRDVDFIRGKNGEGRVQINLSDASMGIDIKQQGQNLVVDFAKTNLPRNLQRKLDVVDFGTPVQLVDAFAQGENVRLVIEPKGAWEYAAYQIDNKFIIEVKPSVEDSRKLAKSSHAAYGGEKLSLNFQNISTREALNVIADFANLNMVISDTVSGSLTLRLKEVPWNQALQIILDTSGLLQQKDGNVIMVAPRDETATRQKDALTTQ